MSESNTEGRIHIAFAKKEAGVEEKKILITPEMYLDGKVWASQKWADTGDVRRAMQATVGTHVVYARSDEALAYSFSDSEGRENILVGNGHHRTAAGIVENTPFEIQIDGDLGVLPQEILENPTLAMQKLAVLGIEGVWPFKTFMVEFVKKKTDLKRQAIRSKDL